MVEQHIKNLLLYIQVLSDKNTALNMPTDKSLGICITFLKPKLIEYDY